MLTIDTQETLVIETDETKDRAEALLAELLQTKAESESTAVDPSRIDPMSVVTGRSSIDNAIERTKRMITLLEHASQALRNGMSQRFTDEERQLLAEIDAELGPRG